MQTQVNFDLLTATLAGLIKEISPNLDNAQVESLLNNTLSSLQPKPKEIKAVAKATDVLINAQAHGSALLSAALRPSRSASTGRWVINFTFNNWTSALTFARYWGAKIGLSLNVQRQGREAFSVSVSLVSAPANKVTVAANFRQEGAADAFAKALKGLTV